VEVFMLPAKTNSIRTPFPLLDDWFNYVFTYFPTTNWQHAFSPTVYFGSNVQDAPVEQHVLDQVGSYGYQLNRIIDVLQVLVKEGGFKGKTPHDKDVIEQFSKLATSADAAAKGFRGEATAASVQNLIQGLRRLRDSDPGLYDDLVKKLQEAFPR
jgi:hypothetical protein